MNLKNSPGISASSQLVLVCDDPHECLWPGRGVLPSHVRQDPAGGPTVKGQDGPASLRFCGVGPAIFRCPRLFVDRFSGGKEKSRKTEAKRGRTGRGGVDKRTVCDTIFKPKAMTKPSGPRRDEREGTVRALRDTDPHATSPAAREDRDGSSPLQDGMRCAFSTKRNQGGTVEMLFRPWPMPGAVFLFPPPRPMRRKIK